MTWLRIDPLRLQVADNLISGTLVLDGAYRPTGVIELDLTDIGSLSALALQTINGSGGGTIRFDVVDNQSIAEIALGFPEIRDEGFSVRDARLTARIADLMGTPEPVGTLDVAASERRLGHDVYSGFPHGLPQKTAWT